MKGKIRVNKPFPSSPGKLKKLLDCMGIIPNRQWGQNFLLDDSVHKMIVSEAGLNGEDAVLEIGAGLGHLTRYIVDKASIVWCLEIDHRFSPILEYHFGSRPGFHLLIMDVLASKHSIQPGLLEIIRPVAAVRPYKILANLPYNIASPVIVNFLEILPQPALMVVTVQKELAQRLIAGPLSPDYGPLSIHAQLRASITCILDIPARAFYPVPKVVSTVVKIVPHSLRPDIQNPCLLSKIVRAVFTMRRKTIYNALRNNSILKIPPSQVQTALELSRISPQCRPEELSLDDFVALANHLHIHKSLSKKSF